MILRPDTQLIEDMNSLQIVFSVDTDGQYRTRCLPGFVNKKYLNRNVFYGLHQESNKKRINEIFQNKSTLYLTDSEEGVIGTKDQLLKLFHEYGAYGVFGYLNTVISDAVVSYKVHNRLHQMSYGGFCISKNLYENVNDFMLCNGTMHQSNNIPELLTSSTYQLLKDSRIPI